jgi:hypothetical protein
MAPALMKYVLAIAVTLLCMLAEGCQQQGGPVSDGTTALSAAADRGAAYFHDRLARSGEWIDTDEYGPCWYPTEVGPDWRPYTDGRWVYTIGNGWLWIGAEKWGWATDHYGQWVFLDSHGWVWVPGKQWSPAWVVWREGEGYIGWAPMPPAKDGQRPLDITRTDSADVPPTAFMFVGQQFIADDHVAAHAEPMTRNVTLLGMTEDATRYQRADGRIFNGGVNVETIDAAAAAGGALRRYHVVEIGTLRPPQIRGEDVLVYRPQIIGDEDTVALMAASASGPPQPPPQPRNPRPEMQADERQRQADYHQQLRAQMDQRHARERSAPSKASSAGGGGQNLATLQEQQERESAVFEDQRQREVEALRRRHRDERDRFAARQKPLGGFTPPGPQETKIYDLPPEWQLPSDLMEPPRSRARPPAAPPATPRP